MGIIRNVAFCPHCNNRAPQTLVHTQRFNEEFFAEGKPSEFLPCFYYVASCETCGRILVYFDLEGHNGPDNFEQAELSWPEKKTLNNAVPNEIRQVYEEAARIQWISPDAFAVQIRRALEIICKDRGVVDRNLQSSLKQLADKGEIPPILAEYTDFLRQLGNVGAHWAGERIDPFQTVSIDEFFRAVVEYIYVAPSKLNDFKERLEYLKKNKSDKGKAEVKF